MTAIFDPFNHCPGLKVLFPEYDYYVYEPSKQLTFPATKHMSNDTFEKMYQFRYLTDIVQIQSDKYDTLFIVIPLLDCYPGNWCTKKEAVQMWNIIQNLCFTEKKRKVCVFDTYDYEYDPSLLFPEVKVDVYFKRNMSKNKSYASNVYPFPYMIFLTPCPLFTLLTKTIEHKHYERKNMIFWSGSLYKHDETHKINKIEERVIKDRETIFNQIQHLVRSVPHLPHEQFLNEMATYKYALDLQGIGDPNSRTFEIFLTGSLRLFNNDNLRWAFEEDDSFSEYTRFSTAEELQHNLNILSNENEYNKALEKQHRLVKKYMNKECLRNYILSKKHI